MPEDQNEAGTAAPTEQIEAPQDAPAGAAPPESWLSELPARPRRRVLSPAPLALLGVLLTACGFIGGVLVEKDQGSASSGGGGGTGGLAARLAGLRGGAGTSAAAAALGGTGGGSAGRGTQATVGQVTFVQGSTLYVSDAEGNTVKVTTSAASQVTKTVSSSVRSVHPGETVVVSGTAGPGGSVRALSIRIGAGAGLGALFGGGGGAALFSGAGGAGGTGGAAGKGSSGSVGGQALFGGG